MESLEISAKFVQGERYSRGYEPVWLIYFWQNDILQYKMLLGYDGSFIDAVPADKKITRTTRYDEGLGARFEFNFSRMSVEEKAAFSQKWVPIVNAYAETHPYYSNRNDNFYKATRQVFGVPTQDHISQEEATSIARRAIADMGANELTLSQREIGYSFDITNPSKPLWVLVLYSVSEVGLISVPLSDDDQTIAVKIDAMSGAVIETIVYAGENSFGGYYR